jgi:hypothetical protein
MGWGVGATLCGGHVRHVRDLESMPKLLDRSFKI